MKDNDFDYGMMTAYAQAKANQASPADDFFSKLIREIEDGKACGINAVYPSE